MKRPLCVSIALGTALALCLTAAFSACATSGAIRAGQNAEAQQDWDRAVIEYTKVVRDRPNDRNARAMLEQAKTRAAQDHFSRARRLSSIGKLDESLVEYQIAVELTPANQSIREEMDLIRTQLRAKIAVNEEGKTHLETVVRQSLDVPMPGQDLPANVVLADTLMFRDANARDIFIAVGKMGDINVVFDPTFRDQPITVDLRKAKLDEALTAVANATRNFWKVTSQRTVTIAPDTPAKRREYEEEIVRTFYLSNADLKETIDMLRIVVDARRISAITATNAVTIKDTGERIAAAGRIIAAIDKARPEVVIDVELLEVDRARLKEYGLQIATPGSPGIDGVVEVARDGETEMSLSTLRSLTQSDVFLAGLPALYYRAIKTDTATRVLANPQLRTSEGIAAQARFGERVPVPVTTFSPIAAGGVQTQPITSFNYENIGVNIDITPRTHHDDDVSLAIRVEVSNISGVGFGNLPTFGNRFINTVIRLKDGETNMLAGLIRDEERDVLDGIPGLSDLPVVGRLFGHSKKTTQQTDIILTLTPRIVRVLDLRAEDLRPFRMGRDSAAPLIDIPLPQPLPPRQPVQPGDVAQPETPGIFPPPQTTPPKAPLLPLPQPAQPLKPPVIKNQSPDAPVIR